MNVSRASEVLSSASDDELVQRFCAGEQEAYDELYARYEPQLRKFFSRKITNAYLLDEAVQRTMILVFRKANRYKLGHSFRNWVFQIMSHELSKSHDWLKRYPGVQLDTTEDAGDGDH